MSQKSTSTAVATAFKSKVKQQKLPLTTQGKVQLQQSKELGDDSFAVNIVSSARTTTFVVHHPIGVTDLDEKDWVFTNASEITNLLARSEDPQQNEIEKARAKVRTDVLVAAGLLTRVDDAVHYVLDGKTGPERKVVLAEADHRLREYKAEVKQAFVLANPQATPDEVNRKVKIDRGRNDFLPEEIKSAEQIIASVLADDVVKEFAETSVPQTFRTMKGDQSDRHQVKCALLGNYDRAHAEDAIIKWLAQNLGSGPDPKPKVRDPATAKAEALAFAAAIKGDLEGKPLTDAKAKTRVSGLRSFLDRFKGAAKKA